MESERTNRRDNRPITPEEQLHAEIDLTRRRGDEASREVVSGDELQEDRLTKSGRMKIVDVQHSEK